MTVAGYRAKSWKHTLIFRAWQLPHSNFQPKNSLAGNFRVPVLELLSYKFKWVFVWAKLQTQLWLPYHFQKAVVGYGTHSGFGQRGFTLSFSIPPSLIKFSGAHGYPVCKNHPFRAKFQSERSNTVVLHWRVVWQCHTLGSLHITATHLIFNPKVNGYSSSKWWAVNMVNFSLVSLRH